MDEITPRDIRILVNASTNRYRENLIAVSDAAWVQMATELLDSGLTRKSPGWQDIVRRSLDNFLPDAVEASRQLTVAYAAETRELGRMVAAQPALATSGYSALSQSQMDAVIGVALQEIMKVKGGTFAEFAPMVVEGQVFGNGRDVLYDVVDDRPVRRPNAAACRFCITMAGVAPYSKNAFHKGCRCVMEPDLRGVANPQSKRIDTAKEYYDKARYSLSGQGMSVRTNSIMVEQRKLLEADGITL